MSWNLKLVILITLFLVFPLTVGAETVSLVPGVAPIDEWNCPKSHPIKGNINKSKKTRIYHVPSGSFYKRTKPELCFTSPKDALGAGFRASKR